jgi:hypothetical protein
MGSGDRRPAVTIYCQVVGEAWVEAHPVSGTTILPSESVSLLQRCNATPEEISSDMHSGEPGSLKADDCDAPDLIIHANVYDPIRDSREDITTQL